MVALLGSIHLFLAVQAAQADLSGVVRDEQNGTPLAGALVALPDLDRLVAADASGRYVLTGVPAGPQHVAVRFIGYAPRTLHVLVPASGRLEVGLSLQPDPFRLRTIEVRPPIALPSFDTASADAFPDRATTLAAVRNHPLLAEPDALLGLGGGEVVVEPESPSGMHVRGAASDQVSYTLDGFPIFSPYHAAGTFAAWNPDALAGIRLTGAAPPGDAPDALAGVISADTREPGARHGTQGSIGTTQARLTLDGPLGHGGAGYLVSLRTGFAGYPYPENDPSYLESESGDGLAKLEVPAVGGRLRLLAYENENEISAAAGGEPSPGLPRHELEWGGRTIGGAWQKLLGRLDLRIAGWSAGAEAGAAWNVSGGRIAMTGERHDVGLQLVLRSARGRRVTAGGIRLEQSATSYATSGYGSDPPWRLRAHNQSVSIFSTHQRPLGRHTAIEIGLAAGSGGRGTHLLPRARLTWSPSSRWTVFTAHAWTRQADQSLRNTESVIGNVFPADLFIGGAAPGVPEARAEQSVLAAEFRPSGALRFGAQLYDRSSHGLLLVAPRTSQPFATAGFRTGEGSARGLALSAAARGSRFGMTAGYTLQKVRLHYGDSTYVPGYGATQLIELGVVVFPTPTLALRLGALGAAGRRATDAIGSLEWEACNLLDRGCELTGSPASENRLLGARRLPGYVRLDLGVRQHWHIRVAGRDASVALFGTLTNLLGRDNVLTYVVNPETGQREPVGMRPRAPLVVGLDWRL